jgi:ribosome maturation factor RimP
LTKEELENVVSPVAEEEAMELVMVQVGRRRRKPSFRIFVDREGGVTLQDCVRLSHRISSVLDRDPAMRGAYSIEVSSPGMDRPIWTKEHFVRFAGEAVRLETVVPIEGRSRFRGRIMGVEGEAARIHLDEGEEKLFDLRALAQARLDLDPWKKPGCARP